jgi:hypothetical protein
LIESIDPCSFFFVARAGPFESTWKQAALFKRDRVPGARGKCSGSAGLDAVKSFAI